MNPDGWITIGTKLDSKQLEKDLIKAEKDLEKWEKQATKLTEKETKIKAKIEIDQADYKRKIKELNQKKSAEYRANEKFGMIQNQDEIDLKYDQLRANLDSKMEKTMDTNNLKLDEIHKKMEENTKEQQRLNEEIAKTTEQLEKAKSGFDLKGAIDNVGQSISNITKKVVRWGLAVFGVRSAYMFVRQAMSTLSQYNEDLANKISNIRLVLAVALEPIIMKIVSLVETLLGYVNYLAKAWFGVDLFARASELSTKGMSSGLKDSTKQAKELKKQLAGFDEIEALQDNQDTGAGNVGGASAFNLNDVKIPKWLEWIKDHGEEIKNIIIAIGVALGAIQFLKLIAWASELSGLLGGLLQIGLIAIGVELLYTALTGRELISDIKAIIKGLKDLEKIRKQQEKQSKQTKESTESLIKTYNDTANSVGVTQETTQNYINTLIEGVNTDNKLIKSMEEQKDWLGELTGGNKELEKTQKTYNETINIQLQELKKLYDSGQLNNKQKAQYKALLEKEIIKLQESNYNLDQNSKEYKNNTEKIKETKTELERITGKTYTVQTYIKDPNPSQFKQAITNLLHWVSNQFDKITIGFGFGTGGGGFRAKGGIYYPKLAIGGIINQPGRGVPYHGATIGESGAEAVVPLTDSQQMALLGEAIGKYININATIPVYVGNRMVAREMQKIQNQTDFATNGR